MLVCTRTTLQPFAVLPLKEELPIYYQVISNPVDLWTIANKIVGFAYLKDFLGECLAWLLDTQGGYHALSDRDMGCQVSFSAPCYERVISDYAAYEWLWKQMCCHLLVTVCPPHVGRTERFFKTVV